MTMQKLLVVPVLVVCIVGTLIGQGSPYSDLTLLVGPQAYLSPAYAVENRSPFAYLFFRGEPIAARIRVFNQGEARATLVPTATVPQQLFAIETTRDGRAFPVQLQFEDRVTRFFSGGRYRYSLDQTLQFDGGEGLEWHVGVTDGTLPAGFYAMTVHVRATDADSRMLRPRAPTFTFEVRAPTVADRPEMLHREADRQIRRAAYDEARATVTELLRIHPQSVIAHMLRQQIAKAEGNRAEFIAAIKQARTLLTGGQDALLLKFKGPEQLRHALEALPVIEEPRP
jgi:hypothetical protein